MPSVPLCQSLCDQSLTPVWNRSVPTLKRWIHKVSNLVPQSIPKKCPNWSKPGENSFTFCFSVMYSKIAKDFWLSASKGTVWNKMLKSWTLKYLTVGTLASEPQWSEQPWKWWRVSFPLAGDLSPKIAENSGSKRRQSNQTILKGIVTHLHSWRWEGEKGRLRTTSELQGHGPLRSLLSDLFCQSWAHPVLTFCHLVSEQAQFHLLLTDDN